MCSKKELFTEKDRMASRTSVIKRRNPDFIEFIPPPHVGSILEELEEEGPLPKRTNVAEELLSNFNDNYSQERSRSLFSIKDDLNLPVPVPPCSQSLSKSDNNMYSPTFRNSLNECLLNVNPDYAYTIFKFVGEGSGGYVYAATRTTKINPHLNPRVIIAVKVLPIEDMQIFESEYIMAVLMGEKDIGPKVFDSFILPSNPPTSLPNGIITMELFEGTMHAFYSGFSKPSLYVLDATGKQVYNLLYRLIVEEGFFCTDLKPGNFVYRNNVPVKMSQGITYTQVRMIDFDVEYCPDIGPLDAWVRTENKYINTSDVCVYISCLIYRIITFHAKSVDPMPHLESGAYSSSHEEGKEIYRFAKEFILNGPESYREIYLSSMLHYLRSGRSIYRTLPMQEYITTIFIRCEPQSNPFLLPGDDPY